MDKLHIGQNKIWFQLYEAEVPGHRNNFVLQLTRTIESPGITGFIQVELERHLPGWYSADINFVGNGIWIGYVIKKNIGIVQQYGCEVV